jgi:hypothetical protein
MRELTVYLKGGSYRVLKPCHPAILKQAYEHEEGMTYFIDADGAVDVMPDKEIESMNNKV